MKDAVRPALGAVDRAAVAVEARLRQGGGFDLCRRRDVRAAGSTGRCRTHSDFRWAREQLLLLMAGGEEALLRATEGAEDQVEHATKLVQYHRIGPVDALIAVAASGTTPFTLSCVRRPKSAAR